jgi:ribosomal protein S18 acetylase RimI-like enzyme
VNIAEYIPSDFYNLLAINNSVHDDPEPSKEFRESIRTADKVWVIRDIGAITVGFLISTFKDNVPYVYNISVHKDWQGIGFGSVLLDYFDKYYEQFPVLWLDVDVNNPAQTLYFRKGYRVANVVQDFYGEQKHALSMVKVR